MEIACPEVYFFPPTFTSSEIRVIAEPAVVVTTINWAPFSTRIELVKAPDKKLVALIFNNLATVRVDAGVSYNPSTNALTVPTINTQFIKTSGGINAIEITEATGNVGISSNLTITGNLYVLGSTTEVNTFYSEIKLKKLFYGGPIISSYLNE